MSLRVAYCVSGGLRSFVAVAPLLHERVIEPTAAGGTLVDCFFHVWLRHGHTLEAAGVEAIRSQPRVVASVVEDPSRRGELTESFYNDSRLFKEAQAAEFRSGGRRGAFRSQWRKVHLALQLALAHEEATSRPYNAFVRARPDMLYSRPLDLGALHAGLAAAAAAGSYLVTPLCVTTNVANDVWMMGTRGAMVAYAAPPTPTEPACCESFVAHRLVHGLGAFEAGCPAAKLPSVCAVSRRQEACACRHSSRLPTPATPTKPHMTLPRGGAGTATRTPLYRIAALGSLVPCPLAAQLAYHHRATCGRPGRSEAEAMDTSMAPLRSFCRGGKSAAPKLATRSRQGIPQLVLAMSCVGLREASPPTSRGNNQTVERIIDAWVTSSREQPRAGCELLPCTWKAPPCQLPARVARRRGESESSSRRPHVLFRHRRAPSS